MKKTIALFMVAALISVGLIASCSDDPAPTTPPEPEVAKYTVIFDPAGRPFDDGTTTIKTFVVNDGATVGDKWPELDEENIGTDSFQGWFDGDTPYLRSTKITKNVILTAKYEAASFTFDNNHTAIHTNFVVSVSPGGTHSAWDGEEEGGNKFTFTAGGIRYRFPVTVDFDYKNYDFVEVEYTASNADGLVLKQYGSAEGYEAFSGGISDTAENEKKTVTWELRQGVEGGFTIQKWNANIPAMTIQITKITFIQKTRYKIKFDTDGGTPASIPDSYLVDGTKVGGYLPADVTKEGFVFTGWMNGAASVGAGTTVNSSFNNVTLKPLWLPDSPGLTSKTIEFAGDLSDFSYYGGSPNVVVTALTGADATKGFKLSGLNYEWKLYTFKVTLDDNVTLAHYDKIEFDFDQTEGSNTTYKSVFVAASNAGTWVSPSTASYIGTKAITNTVASEAKTSLSFNIVKPLAAGLTGEVEVCIYIPAGDTAVYTIKNIVFVKE